MYLIFGPPHISIRGSTRKKTATPSKESPRFYAFSDDGCHATLEKRHEGKRSDQDHTPQARLDGRQQSGLAPGSMDTNAQQTECSCYKSRIGTAAPRVTDEAIPANQRPRSIFYDVTDFETSRTHMNNPDVIRDPVTYELSDDILQKQVEALERKYGGHLLARHAAMVIQRAYRTYCLRKEFKKLLSVQNGRTATGLCPKPHIENPASAPPYPRGGPGRQAYRAQQGTPGSCISSYFPQSDISSVSPPDRLTQMGDQLSQDDKPTLPTDPKRKSCSVPGHFVRHRFLVSDHYSEKLSRIYPEDVMLSSITSRKISDSATTGTFSRLKSFRLSRRAKSSDRCGSASDYRRLSKMQSDPSFHGTFRITSISDRETPDEEVVHQRRKAKQALPVHGNHTFGLLKITDKLSAGCIGPSHPRESGGCKKSRYKFRDLDKVHPRRDSRSRPGRKSLPDTALESIISHENSPRVDRTVKGIRRTFQSTEVCSVTTDRQTRSPFNYQESAADCGPVPCSTNRPTGSLCHGQSTLTSNHFSELALTTRGPRADRRPTTPPESCQRGPSTSTIPSMFPKLTASRSPVLNRRTCVTETERKRQYRIALNVFNKKPEKGLDLLTGWKFIDSSPNAVANFLLEPKQGLSKQMIGEFLGDLQNHFNMEVLQHFASQLDFTGFEVDVALRKFQSHFRLPGEAQKIERIIEIFAGRYLNCNPDVLNKFKSLDTVFILSFAIIMLNTDLHSPSVKPDRKMKLDDFANNLKGIDGGNNIDYDLLCDIYNRVKDAEFKHNADHVTQVIKLDRMITGKKPLLPLPHRRLVCYCRLYEVPDIKKKQGPNIHQREVFLFNDIIVITKILNKRKTNVTYTFRESLSLAGMDVCSVTTPHYPYGIKIVQSFNIRSIIFYAKQESEKVKFLEDLEESIKEADEMETLRIEAALEKQGWGTRSSCAPDFSTRATSSPRISENRDSGLGETDDAMISSDFVSPEPHSSASDGVPSTGLERCRYSTSTGCLSGEACSRGDHSGCSELVRLRQPSLNSLDSGMSSTASLASRESTKLPPGPAQVDQSDGGAVTTPS